MVRFLDDKSNGRWVRFWVMHFDNLTRFYFRARMHRYVLNLSVDTWGVLSFLLSLDLSFSVG
jgi:hypothetical protein